MMMGGPLFYAAVPFDVCVCVCVSVASAVGDWAVRVRR